MLARLRLPAGRDVHAVVRMELFVVFAVSTILGTRAFLALSGYPQIGGDGLHIAHMLWGGLLMMIAFALVLGFVQPRMKDVGAIVGGAGFGLFIDEVGKFVTSDNDYFFQPSFAIMYLVFVGMVFGVRYVFARSIDDASTQLANAAAIASAGPLRGLHAAERTEAQELVDEIRASGRSDVRLTDAVQELIDASPAMERGRWYTGVREIVVRLASYVLSRKRTFTIVCVILGYQVVDAVSDFVRSIIDGGLGDLDTAGTIKLIAGLAVGAVIAVGFIAWRGDRLRGLRVLRAGVLLNILVLQVFQFHVNQLDAIPGVVINVAAWVTLNYQISHHERTEAHT